MARIPLAEVPNAPQLAGAPPVANYPAVPATRLQAQPYVQGHMKPMQTIANFEQYAKDLQQAPLPSGFAEGAAMTSAAAGRYASFAGEATEEIGRTISNSLNAIGSVISDAANKANQSKDAVDLIRYSYLEDQAKMAANADMDKRNIPVEQRPEMWRSEYAPRFMASAQNLGTTPATRAKIQAHAAGFVESQYLGYELGVPKKMHQDNIDFLNASYEEAAKKGDAAGMRTAAYELRAQNYENDGKLKLRLGEADRVEHKATIDFVRQRNPQELRDQAIAARDGKATGEFKFLNEDPALAAQTAAVAAQEVNTRQAEKQTEISNRMLNRDTRMTDAQIETEGRAAGLDEEDIVKLKKQNVLEVPWNDQKVAEANTIVATYDPRDDIDPKTKLPTIEKYKEALDFINENVPKEYRQPLITELNKARREYLQGEKKNPLEKRRGDYLQDLDRLAKSELLGPTGLSKKAGEKDKIIDVKAHAELFKKVTTIQNGIDDLLEKAQAEKWPMTKFDEEYRKLLVPFMSKEAGEAYYKNAIPPVPSEEQKAREAPRATQVAPGQAFTTPSGQVLIAGGYPVQPFAPGSKPSQPPYPLVPGGTPAVTTPRVLRETPAFSAAWDKFARSDQPQLQVTAYTPGRGDIRMEGGNKVAGRRGPAFTMEEYQAGTVPHVSVAMDENSAWQGKYVMSPSYPGVVFKVEDTGDAFKGKGEGAIDIAFKDRSKATDYSKTATFAPIDEPTARDLAGLGGEKKVGAVNLKNVNPTLVTKLETLQQKFGNLNIISGYRSPEHNLAVGGARGSQHTHGNAVDINVRGMSIPERLALIEAASKAGITGIGVYANTLHFDVGPRRAWGPSHHFASVPDWAQEVINRHVSAG